MRCVLGSETMKSLKARTGETNLTNRGKSVSMLWFLWKQTDTEVQTVDTVSVYCNTHKLCYQKKKILWLAPCCTSMLHHKVNTGSQSEQCITVDETWASQRWQVQLTTMPKVDQWLRVWTLHTMYCTRKVYIAHCTYTAETDNCCYWKNLVTSPVHDDAQSRPVVGHCTFHTAHNQVLLLEEPSNIGLAHDDAQSGPAVGGVDMLCA